MALSQKQAAKQFVQEWSGNIPKGNASLCQSAAASTVHGHRANRPTVMDKDTRFVVGFGEDFSIHGLMDF